VKTWTELELRNYYTCGGASASRPEERDTSVAGGARRLKVDPRSCPDNAPPTASGAPSREVYSAANYRCAGGA
jgi:hypothetical protein